MVFYHSYEQLLFCGAWPRFEDISQYVDPKPLSRRPIFLMTCRGELGLPYKPNATLSGREGA